MTLLHFTALEAAAFVPGSVLSTDWGESNYWQQKTAGQRIGSLPQKLVSQFAAFASAVGDPQVGQQLRQFVDIFGRQLWHRAELLKEHVFEQIRVTAHPEVPSRMRCMYLFDAALDPDEYARAIGFNPSTHHLIEVEPVHGHHHALRGRLSLLNCNMQVYDAIVRNARSYWQGVQQIDMDTEILLEGSVRVAAVLR